MVNINDVVKYHADSQITKFKVRIHDEPFSVLPQIFAAFKNEDIASYNDLGNRGYLIDEGIKYRNWKFPLCNIRWPANHLIGYNKALKVGYKIKTGMFRMSVRLEGDAGQRKRIEDIIISNSP